MKKRSRRRLRPSIVLILFMLLALLIFGAGYVIFNAITPNDVPDETDSETVQPISPEKEDIPVEPDVPVEPDEPTEKDTDETRLSFVAAGDNLIHQAIIDDAKRLADERGLGEEYYFDSMYDDFRDTFKSADISFINQESMIAGESFPYSGYPHFNTPPQMVKTLENLGIDVVNIATNHSFDLTGKGLLACVDAFKNSSITSIGGYDGQDDYNDIRIIEKEGIKIAFLAYTYGTNEYAGSSYPNAIVPIINHTEMKRQVAEAKKLADLVFVSMHWGTESSFDVSSSQKSAAQVLVDAGVDVIIGTHSHTVQEMKWRDRPDGGKTLITYSLGNFISTMHPAYNMFGGLLSLDIVKDKDGIRIENPLYIPTMTHYSLTRDSLHVYRLEDYSQELYEKHGTTLQVAGWSYNRIVNTVKDVIDEEFLEDWIINY